MPSLPERYAGSAYRHTRAVLERLSSVTPDTRDVRTARLRDGRRLAYDEVGDPRGVPVLYFHGGGDSRLTRHPDDKIAESLGIRLIAVDRPGSGRSDLRARRSLIEWPLDVDQLADAIGLERFAVLGWSAGGPHALACARVLRDRVVSATVVAGLPEAAGFRQLPHDLQLTFRLARRDPRLAVLPLAQWGRRVPPPTGDAECDRAYASGRLEAFRQGSRGLACELHMLARPWGFRPEEIRLPVSLWYGARDRVCPASIGHDLAARIPGARLTVVDEGHQLMFSRWRELLADLFP
jgi:pimeloyl-ACP methyl ester carboxylesterase